MTRRVGRAAPFGVPAIRTWFRCVGRVATRQDVTPRDPGALRHLGAFPAAATERPLLAGPPRPPGMAGVALPPAGMAVGFARAR